MIAIPLSKEDSTVISDLYGNAPYFALLDLSSGNFSVVENRGCGNGIDTAKCVKDLGASRTIFYHMGEGVFKNLEENKIKVYSATKVFLTIEEIYRNFINDVSKLVTKSNCDTLLDPGTSSCSCECDKN
ncbi:MAG: dinitrogenase iron-molybdenum cofactor biosynthesis protein [Arcobacter sp.]|uniref:NifB/NifX family molybdenum-iron cluster-binding protein n=1 Tax=uncultured Arcobacter sp. TaxID=165434 RepID=UPI000CAA81E0|nr:NifB/NifX family molybdenum-iron cluster-binding protein [uncultured Arcobacter sp.]PLY10764.1 MAG: dinitrogenase iron-molybdenum cofactor biosynthesis protein [Arcobacter sp.]